MGYNVTYEGKFNFKSGRAGEALLKGICGEDARDIEGFPREGSYAVHLDFVFEGDHLVWNDDAEKSWIDAPFLHNIATFIRKIDPKFSWTTSRVVAKGEDGEQWILLCDDMGNWCRTDYTETLTNIGEALDHLEELLEAAWEEAGTPDNLKSIDACIGQIRKLTEVSK